MRCVRFTAVVSLLVLIICAVALIGCGSSHATLTSITVSPAQAGGVAPNGKVNFTASGQFSDNSSRQLSAADGVTWQTSDTNTATIDNNGVASCLSSATVTITATAPANTGVNNTSTNVSGTASLKCVLGGF